MPPRPKKNPDALTPGQQELQDALAEAREALECAKAVADRIGEGFAFLDKVYVPKQTRTVEFGGGWDDEVDDEWDSSSC